MSEIFQRLNSRGYVIPEPCIAGTKQWQFSPLLDTQNIEFFRYFVDHHELLSIEYSMHRAQLVALMNENPSEENLAKGYELVKTLLRLSELLERVYGDYLIVPRETQRLQTEQVAYRNWLAQDGYKFLDPRPITGKSQITVNLRNLTQDGNFPRNLLARCWRLLRVIPPLLNPAAQKNLLAFLKIIEKYVQPVLAWAAWIFFIPRLLTNIVLIIKHTIGSNGKEKDLGAWFRFITQLKRRWVELANDSSWITFGLLNCFVLIGALAPLGIFANVAVLMLDTFYAVTRFVRDITRLEKLERKYMRMLNQPGHFPELDVEQTRGYLTQIRLRIIYEKKNLTIQVVHTSLIFTAFLFTGLLFAVNPILAVACASLAIAITFRTFYARRSVVKLKPSDTIPPKPDQSPHVRQSFFRPTAEPLPIHASRSESHFRV